MENNLFEQYELINGNAVIDSDYNIITANEEFYKYIGFNIESSILQFIHQVDIDDFVSVVNTIQFNIPRNMVLRMRRSDNSYRWMLFTIKRFTVAGNGNSAEYADLEITDIIALKSHNDYLQNAALDFSHLMAMENELFFSYEKDTDIFMIKCFIDNELTTIFQSEIDKLNKNMIDNKIINDDSIDAFNLFYNDIKQGKVSFSYKIKADFSPQKTGYSIFEFRGSSIYNNMELRKVVGSIRNLNKTPNDIYNPKTYEYNIFDIVSPYKDIKTFCEKNISLNKECTLTMILMEIDNYEHYSNTYGADFVKQLEKNILNTSRQIIGYRGIICKLKENLYSIALKHNNTEANVRALIQSIRSNIYWNYIKQDQNINITFSIGVSRYPNNGYDLSQIKRKLVRALQIAEERGGKRYIIYKEYLHGDMD